MTSTRINPIDPTKSFQSSQLYKTTYAKTPQYDTQTQQPQQTTFFNKFKSSASLSNDPEEQYIGLRGDDFIFFIKKILLKSKMKEKYISLLLTSENLKIYDSVFTSKSSNPDSNYEIFEQLGDLTANKFIVHYMYHRFPQLRCTEGVKIVARLRINYGSRNSFFNIAENLGFWDFISASISDRERCKKPLLEDVFEAFIGATEYILDTMFRTGVGYSIVYDILSSIFNEIKISLKYCDLYDAKTRLKELIDCCPQIGTLRYVDTIKENNNNTNVNGIVNGSENNISGSTTVLQNYKLTLSTIFLKQNNVEYAVGSGTAAKKPDAQQYAARMALSFLNKKGFYKEESEFYKKLINSNLFYIC